MIEAILYIGIAQCLFAALVVVSKKRKYTPDKVLIAWLLSIAFKFLLLLLNNAHKEFFDIQFSAGFIPLSFGPFLYLYTRFLTDEDARFRPVYLLHFLPFFLMTLLYFLFFNENLSFDESRFLERDPWLWARISYAGIYFSSILAYTIITFIKLREFRRKMPDKFSFDNPKNRLNWLYFITVLFTATFLFYFIIGIINAASFRQVIESSYFTSAGLTIIAFSVSYFGLRQTNLFKNLPDDAVIQPVPLAGTNDRLEQISALPKTEEAIEETKEENNKGGNSAEEKYKKSGLREENVQPQIDRLIRYVEQEKPYLNPELTIQDLSTQVNISKHHLTQIINNNLGKNFFNFINEYRVEEVKRKIADPQFSHLTLLAIAFESGFNSKSSFNSIFKQHTGLTPSDYRKKNQGSSV